MLHTKTPEGIYDENDYWIVSFIDIRSMNPDDYKEVVREYSNVDNAYEDYCYFDKQSWVRDCKYEHHRR